MTDPHQIITIIAAAIHDCQKEIAEESVLEPEQASTWPNAFFSSGALCKTRWVRVTQPARRK